MAPAPSLAVLDPRAPAERRAIEEAWAALAAADAGELGLFHEPAWFWPNLDYISPPEQRLRFALVEAAGTPLALIPFERRRWRRRKSRSPAVVGFLAPHLTGGDAALFLRRGHEAVAVGLFLRALGERAGPRLLSLDGLEVDGRCHRALASALATAPAAPEQLPPRGLQRVRLAADMHPYLESRSRNHRRTLKRGSARLAQLGEVRLEATLMATAEEFEPLARLGRAGWREATTDDRRTAAAYRDYCVRLLVDGDPAWRHHRFLLRVGDDEAAGIYALASRDRIYGLQILYAPKYAAASPGLVLLHGSILELAREYPGGTYEFLGDNAYLHAPATDAQVVCRDLFGLPTPGGRLTVAALTWLQQSKRGLARVAAVRRRHAPLVPLRKSQRIP